MACCGRTIGITVARRSNPKSKPSRLGRYGRLAGLLVALNSLSELPLVGPLSGAKQTPLWQPLETGF
jgi:hypothetical protein